MSLHDHQDNIERLNTAYAKVAAAKAELKQLLTEIDASHPPSLEDEPNYSLTEAATYCGVALNAIRWALARRQLKQVPVPPHGKLRLVQSHLDAWKRQNGGAP